jgi:hypothetical protein
MKTKFKYMKKMLKKYFKKNLNQNLKSSMKQINILPDVNSQIILFFFINNQFVYNFFNQG